MMGKITPCTVFVAADNLSPKGQWDWDSGVQQASLENYQHFKSFHSRVVHLLSEALWVASVADSRVGGIRFQGERKVAH